MYMIWPHKKKQETKQYNEKYLLCYVFFLFFPIFSESSTKLTAIKKYFINHKKNINSSGTRLWCIYAAYKGKRRKQGQIVFATSAPDQCEKKAAHRNK